MKFCARCGFPHNGRFVCDDCTRERAKKNRLAHIKRCKAKGLCLRCLKRKARKGKTECQPCAAMHVKSQQRYRARMEDHQ